jgi:hypothetical protein
VKALKRAHRDVGGGGGSVSNGEREEREREGQERGMGEGRSSGERLRYTVEEAAAVLGMTTGAVRNRLSQGTLRSVEEHGTVYVLLPADTARDAARDTGDIPGEFLLPADTSGDTAQDTARVTGDIPGGSSALMSEMHDRIAFLERERERKDTILLSIAEAVKDISSPTEQPVRVRPQMPLEGVQEPAQEERRSWWSRMFGG